ncbi:MAG: YigZ family protein [Balneolaceae bacterium]
MNTINKTYEISFREKGSKFIGFLFSCDSEEAFGEKLEQLKAKYPDASHHCYAWRIHPNNIKEYSSDDGEPSGTAGLPILNQLKSLEVVNAAAIVVRYFGGAKLGKPGLIEAYGLAANECLSSAELVKIVPVHIFEIHYPYPEENLINKLISSYNLIIQESEYMEHVTLKIACPKRKATNFEKELAGLKHLNISFEKLEESYL